MRLLIVDHNALDPAGRQIYRHIVKLGGIDLRLVVPSKWNNNFTRLNYSSDNAEELEMFPSVALFSSRTHRMVYWSLKRHLTEFQPDLFYINAEPENFQTIHAAWLSSRYHVPFVFSTWRNIDHVNVGYPYKMSFVHAAAEKYVMRHALHGIAFNPTAVKIFKENGCSRLTFIPPSVEVSDHSLVPRSPSGEFVVGYVGRLAEAKGVDDLIRAVAVSALPCKLFIVGSGSEMMKLDSLSKSLGISDRVVFHGPVVSENVKQLLRQLDVLVLPSKTTQFWREQFGRVLIEAMAEGVPVIGSSSGEIPYVIGEAGLVFDEGDVQGLKNCIERIAADDSLRSRLIEQGRRRVSEMFSIETVAQQYHSLFLSLHESPSTSTNPNE